MAFCFAMFFLGSLMLGLVFCPVLWLLTLGRKEKVRDLATAFIGKGYGSFILCIRIMGLIRVDAGELKPPPELEGRPYVLVANHPTLLDVTFFLNRFPGLTCVVKKSWYDFFFFGTLLRSTHYLPNADVDDDGLGTHVLDRMVAHVKGGHPLAMFPEGTRSLATSLHRFKRGAFELAERAGVPLVMVFVDIDRPFLMKNVPFWKTASGRAHYRFRILEVVEPSAAGDQGLQRRNDAQRKYEAAFRASLEERAIKDLPPETETEPLRDSSAELSQPR